MHPAQRNKVDMQKLTPEEQELFRKFGRLPTRKDLLSNKLKERKYFDSGDYALSKAGKASDAGITNIGAKHATPEDIPHSSSNNHTPNGQAMSSSPVKSESSLLNEVPAELR